MRFELDCEIECADGGYGALADLVIDAKTRRLTHLVVHPHGRPELARMVPVSSARVDRSSSAGISLNCTIAEIDQLAQIHESQYVRIGDKPVEDSPWSPGIEEVATVSTYEAPGIGTLGGGVGPVELDPHVIVNYDRVPHGTVEIRRESEVITGDNKCIGHVVAVVVDDQAQIREFVLEHGHLWGKREIVIPIDAVARIESDEIVLALSSDGVKSVAREVNDTDAR